MWHELFSGNPATGSNKLVELIGTCRDERLLRRPFLFFLARQAVRRGLIKFPYRATSMLVEYILEQLGKAFKRNTDLVWSSAFYPTELLYALGVNHFSPEVTSAVAASFGLQEKLLREAETNWWGRDSCSFHRCALGGILLDCFPRPRAFCASTMLCDGGILLFNNLAARYRLPMLLLDLPLRQDRQSLEYVVRQLKEMIAALEGYTGKKLQMERLEEAVACADAARRELEEVNRLRTHPLSPFGARQATAYLYLYFNGLGSPVTPKIYHTLSQELETKINAATATGTRPPGLRLLWLHLPPLVRGNNLLAYLEERGAKVVFEEYSQVYWGPMEPRNPLESVAGRLLSHFGYGPIERRLQVIKTMAERFAVDGVIHFSHWGCRQNSGSVKIMRDYLRRAGIPLLLLDGDCADNRNNAAGQLRTRIDGFLEMLA